MKVRAGSIGGMESIKRVNSRACQWIAYSLDGRAMKLEINVDISMTDQPQRKPNIHGFIGVELQFEWIGFSHLLFTPRNPSSNIPPINGKVLVIGGTYIYRRIGANDAADAQFVSFGRRRASGTLGWEWCGIVRDHSTRIRYRVPSQHNRINF